MSAAQSQQHQHQPILRIRASDIVRVHTILGLLAFGSAFVLGCLFHYKKIVKNGIAGYPQEWFPSVSATIGDWYPERGVFQILIALNSGPRFALGTFQYLVQRKRSSLALVVFITGIIRTLSCGGWVYITSTDDHDVHDVLMITYILCNIPWMVGGIACTPKERVRQRRRRFFGSIVPMIYFFIQHKVHRIPGAYTHYSFFEWGLIITDILYDSVTELTFAEANLEITIGASSHMDLHTADQPSIEHKLQSSNAIENSSSTELKSLVNNDNKKSSTEDPPLPAQNTLSRISLFFSALRSHKDMLSFVVDLYLAFIFWTIFTSLILTLFYFSVWELGIAGAEATLLSILSPAMLGIKPFRTWASTKSGRVSIHALSLAGLVAYRFPSPALRLLFVTFATFIVCIGAAVDWSNRLSVTYNSILLGLGLILSSLSKHANHSNNPLWPMVDERNGGYNKTGIFLAALAILHLALRDDSSQTQTDTNAEQKQDVDRETRLRASTKSWFPGSLALGSLIFSLHCFLTDPSTLIAWSWTGYPIKGPLPHLHGTLTHIAQSVGLLLVLLEPSANRVLTSPLWFFCGTISAYVLYNYKDWFGYYGGLGFAVFLMSIIPQTLQKAASSPFIGRTYFTAFLVTVLLYLANVWTVAYAFVPAGHLLRERTDLVLMAQIILLAPAFDWQGSKYNRTSLSKIPPRLGQYSFTALSLMAVVSGLVTMYRTPTSAPQPYRPGPRIVRAGIWTVHFGMDNQGRDSQRAMRDLIRDLELDVVGLLETDLHRTVYGNRDLTRVMAEEIGFYVDLGPGPNQHTWGAVLLSKFPIINSTHHLLPSPNGELAPAISAFLNMYGTEVLVVVSHNGQEEDPLDRELQSTELARIMNSTYPAPAIFLGYVVTKPHASRPAPYRILVEDGRMHDIDSDDLDRWCEYILYRGLYRTSYLRMSRGKVTDTELQAGQFVVPRFGHTVVDDSEAGRYLRIHKETLDAPHWFPMEYYGDRRSGGKNGHYYHVFGTPLYYNLPEGALL
ncbi:CWH43 [Sanghuangporus vaninii]